MKVGISLICKGDDEYDYLKALLKSLRKHTGDVFITLTSDNTEKSKKLIQKVGGHHNFFKWCDDFSKARNFGYDSLPEEYTHIFTCDSDDIVQNPGNIQVIANDMQKMGADSCYIPYITGKDKEYGDQITNVIRIVRRGSGHWVRPIHEVWVSDTDKAIADRRVKCIHTKKDVLAGETRNLNMLLAIKKKTDEDHRYIASAYLTLNKTDEALEHLLRIKPSFGFYYDVLNTIASIYKFKGKLDKSIETVEKLVRKYKNFSDPYFVMGGYLIDKKEYERALETYLEGVKHPKMHHIMSSSSHNVFINPLGKMAFLYETLGMHDKAVWCVEVLKKIAPDLAKVKSLEEIIKEK